VLEAFLTWVRNTRLDFGFGEGEAELLDERDVLFEMTERITLCEYLEMKVCSESMHLLLFKNVETEVSRAHHT
jgi:hypothetical protein